MTTTKLGSGVREVEPGVHEIDHHFLGEPGVIASYLLRDESSGELALIEAGPGSTIQTLLAGIRAADADPARVTKILLTHIHLDHAGAAGALRGEMPDARVYVHPVGAPHLIDPSKLLASAERIYGDDMQRLWGDFLPVPADRLVIPGDGEVIAVAGRRLIALDTPGHAVHHYAYHDPERDSVYCGDVAGIRLERSRYVRPPTPPPELDLDAWRTSIARIRRLAPRRLYLTHFGAVDDPDWHLDELISRLFLWAGRIGSELEANRSADEVGDSLRASELPMLEALGNPELARRYEAAGNYRMSADGFVRYFRKRGQIRR